jgi:ATP-dependent RNA helicase DeaD
LQQITNMSFNTFGLKKEILDAVEEAGFTSPTPIQEQTIPVLVANNTDFIGMAQTGTGKTAAFSLPLLQYIEPGTKHIQAIILCPTRELCVQITKDIKRFSSNLPAVKIVPVYGGVSIDNQIREIKRGVQIVVATPGRMQDLMDRGVLKIDEIRTVVLDEADEMLNMGFRDAITEILSQTPEEKTIWLFSATMPREILNITKSFMEDPVKVSVAASHTSAENISHEYYVIHARERFAALKRIIDYNPGIYAIIFCRTKADCQYIAEHLIKEGYNADALHGDLSQQQRENVMGRFRMKSLQFLVATDVAARGIDVNDVSHVIHYELPDDMESYTHRSGRTARAGKSGVSAALVHSRELYKVKDIERLTKTKLVRKRIPNGEEVCERQLLAMVNAVKDAHVEEEEIERFLPATYEMLSSLSKEEIIKRLVSVEFNRFLMSYKNAADLNVNLEGGRDSRGSRDDSRGGARSGSKGTRFFISIGELDGIKEPLQLIRHIEQVAGLDKKTVQRVQVNNSYSFFEVPAELAGDVKEGFKDEMFKGRKVRVEESGAEGGGGGGRDRDRGGRSGGGDRRGGYGGRGRSGGSGGSGGGNRFGGSRDGGSRDGGKKPERRRRS